MGACRIMQRAGVCLETYVGFGNEITWLATLASLSDGFPVIPCSFERYPGEGCSPRSASNICVQTKVRGTVVPRSRHRNEVRTERGRYVQWATYIPVYHSHM